MTDYKTQDGGTPENGETRQSDDLMQNSAAGEQTGAAGEQTGGAGTPQSPDPQNAARMQNTYISNSASAQNAWQQPYSGNQPQNQYRPQAAYQQQAAYQRPGYYRPQYPYPPQYNSYNHPSRGKATASLVLGIISLVFFWLSFFAIVSVICSIIGIVMGNSARKELSPEQGRGQATAGLVCSIIGLVLSIIMLVVFTLIIIITAVSYAPEFGGYM